MDSPRCVIKLERMNFDKLKSIDTEKTSKPPTTTRNKTVNRTVNENQLETTQEPEKDRFYDPRTPKANVEFSIELKRAINDRNILTSKTKKRVFEALDEIRTKSEEESRNFKKEKALLEIVNSEIKYVHQLEIIIEFFMKPAKARNLLKPDDFDILFGNITTIYNVNKELLEELDLGFDNVPNAFSKIAPYLKLYSVYAYEFKNVLNLLQKVSVLYPSFAKFLENQESRPEVQSKLSALLIAPIQRVPRYKLLLANLHRLTKPADDDHQSLSDCVRKIEEAAEHINRTVEEQENARRLLELQRRLRHGEPNLVSPGRRLVKEGVLRRLSQDSKGRGRKVYVALASDIVLFCEMKGERPGGNSLRCSSIFPMGQCRASRIEDKGCVRLSCQQDEVVLYHENADETRRWADEIEACIRRYAEDRRTLRKENSGRRPVKRKDVGEYHEAGVSPGRPLKKRKTGGTLGSEESKSLSSVSSPRRITKRKSIHDAGQKALRFDLLADSKPSGSVCESEASEMGDVLPGLPETQPAVCQANNEKALSKDVFVFGRANNEGFKSFGRFIGGVGTTIKRMFGFAKER